MNITGMLQGSKLLAQLGHDQRLLHQALRQLGGIRRQRRDAERCDREQAQHGQHRRRDAPWVRGGGRLATRQQGFGKLRSSFQNDGIPDVAPFGAKPTGQQCGGPRRLGDGAEGADDADDAISRWRAARRIGAPPG